jgi:DNA polymerase-4
MELQENRKIIHVDMDAFYASVEQRDFPELKGKPIAVGGSQERGVVAAASYEARKFGVKSAMASSVAARRCPQLIFVKPRFEVYQAVSKIIRGIFFDYTDLVEPLSLDEAYLDVTHNKIGLPSATLIAEQILQRIFEETQLTASAGVSYNKFLAKTASDINKPNGLTVVLPGEAEALLDNLPIERFFGVGKVTAEKMHSYGVRFGRDLRKWSLEDLEKHFGKQGAYYYSVIRGIDNRHVNADRLAKSYAIEDTFNSNIDEVSALLSRLESLAGQLEKRLSKKKVQGKTVTLKVKFADFTIQTRSLTGLKFIGDQDAIFKVLSKLILRVNLEQPVRLVGIQLSNLNNVEKVTSNGQLTFEF